MENIVFIGLKKKQEAIGDQRARLEKACSELSSTAIIFGVGESLPEEQEQHLETLRNSAREEQRKLDKITRRTTIPL